MKYELTCRTLDVKVKYELHLCMLFYEVHSDYHSSYHPTHKPRISELIKGWGKINGNFSGTHKDATSETSLQLTCIFQIRESLQQFSAVYTLRSLLIDSSYLLIVS